MRLSELNSKDVSVVSPGKPVARLSDLDPAHVQVVKEKKEGRGLLDRASSAVGTGLEYLDRYTSAPVRAATDEFQKRPPTELPIVSLGQAAVRGARQIGKPSDTAPTVFDNIKNSPLGPTIFDEKNQVRFAEGLLNSTSSALEGLFGSMGGNDPGWTPEAIKKSANTPEGKMALPIAASIPVAAAQDPLTYINPLSAAKSVAGALPKVGKTLVRGGETAYNAAKTGMKSAAAKGFETMTGGSPEAYKAYLDEFKAVKDLNRKYGVDTQTAANDLRKGIRTDIKTRKSQLNAEIGDALSAADPGQAVDAGPIVDKLMEAKAGLDPKIDADQLKVLDDTLNLVTSSADEGGMLSPQQAYRLQKRLQRDSRNSFVKDGQFIKGLDSAKKGLKDAYSQSIKTVGEAIPEVRSANKQLSDLYDLQATTPKPIIGSDKKSYKPWALERAGLLNGTEAEELKRLGDWTGQDYGLKAKQFGAYSKFAKTPVMAYDSTGKAAARMGLGALTGQAAGDTPEERALYGLLGAAASSPTAWKLGTDAFLYGREGARAAGGLIKRGIEKAGPGVKEFIRDEEGAFTPGQLRGLLKEGTENTYDLTKAREVAGPAKKPMPGEAGSEIAKYRPPLNKEERQDLLNWIDSAYSSLRQGQKLKEVDKRYLTEMLPVAPEYQKNYIKDLLKKIDEPGVDDDFVNKAKELTTTKESTKPAVEAAKNFKPGQVIESEDGKKWTVVDNTNKGGLIMLRNEEGGITHDYADSLWEYAQRQLDPQSPKGLLTNLNVEKGASKPLERPGEVKFFGSPKVTPGPGQIEGQVHVGKSGPLAGKQFTVVPGTPEIRNKGADIMQMVEFEDGSRQWMKQNDIFWALEPDTDPTNPFASLATKEEQKKRLEEIGNQMKAHNERSKLMKAAEEERVKKGLLSLDIPKKRQPKSFDDYLEIFEKQEKKKPVDVPLGGQVELKKSMSNSVEITPKRYEVLEALDDEPGYLVRDPDSGEVYTVFDDDISRVVKPNKPKPKKPKK